MTPENNLPAAITQTILAQLAPLFLNGAGGDPTAARHAASRTLAAYQPETPSELRLAANIISFSFHALEALAQATTPDMSLNKILRLRGSAVSLSRESEKAQRRLDRLQQARRQGIQPSPADTQNADTQNAHTQNAHIQNAEAPQDPRIDKALALIQDTGAIAATAKANNLTWTQAYEQRQRDARIAAGLKRAEARAAAQVTPGAIANHPQPTIANAI